MRHSNCNREQHGSCATLQQIFNATKCLPVYLLLPCVFLCCFSTTCSVLDLVTASCLVLILLICLGCSIQGANLLLLAAPGNACAWERIIYCSTSGTHLFSQSSWDMCTSSCYSAAGINGVPFLGRVAFMRTEWCRSACFGSH